MAFEDPSQDEMRRAKTALAPFVDAFNLPVNPEELDEIAFAVLRHSRSEETLDEIVSSVNEQIADFLEKTKRMRRAMDAHYHGKGSYDPPSSA